MKDTTLLLENYEVLETLDDFPADQAFSSTYYLDRIKLNEKEMFAISRDEFLLKTFDDYEEASKQYEIITSY